MALETLKDVVELNGYEVEHVLYDAKILELSNPPYIVVDDTFNRISFKIQDGPIKEVGVNGCQIDEMIQTCFLIIEGLNKNFPSEYNDAALEGLCVARESLKQRKINRETRGVEGVSSL